MDYWLVGLLLEYTALAIFLFGLVAYGSYYLTCVPKQPTIAASDKFTSFLLQYCPVLREKYWPTFWCFEARIQSIMAVVFRSSPNTEYYREVIQTKDGGQIGLDWHEPTWPGNGGEVGYAPDDDTPIVIIIPGIVGCSKERYIRHLVRITASTGYRSVVVNHRGRAGVELLTPRLYCATDITDLLDAVLHVRSTRPEALLIGVGVSLGAIILSTYLSKTGAGCNMKAAMLLVVPWNALECNSSMMQPLNFYMFNRYILLDFLDLVQRNLTIFSQETWFDDRAVFSSRSTAEFDNNFTCKRFGYSSVEDYYRDASVDRLIHHFPVPVLCLNSKDDVFSPAHAIPMKEAGQSRKVAIVCTDYGGHTGFLEGLCPRDTSYMHRLYEQYIKAVVQHGEELDEVMEKSSLDDDSDTTDTDDEESDNLDLEDLEGINQDLEDLEDDKCNNLDAKDKESDDDNLDPKDKERDDNNLDPKDKESENLDQENKENDKWDLIDDEYDNKFDLKDKETPKLDSAAEEDKLSDHADEDTNKESYKTKTGDVENETIYLSSDVETEPLDIVDVLAQHPDTDDVCWQQRSSTRKGK